MAEIIHELKCTKCNKVKPVSEFSKDTSRAIGYQYTCKNCKNAYYKANKSKLEVKRKAYREANKDKKRNYDKKYREENKDKIKARKKEWEKRNRLKLNKQRNEKIKTDSLYRLKHYCRTRLNHSFRRRGYSKTSKTQGILGIDYNRLVLHIERQFTEGMTWDNQGDWHIDHIIPLSSAKTEDELLKLCHYTNLQPLWAVDNITKSNKIVETQILLRI